MKKFVGFTIGAGLTLGGLFGVIHLKRQDQKTIKMADENLKKLEEIGNELQKMTEEMDKRNQELDERIKEIEKMEDNPEREPWSEEELEDAINSFGEV